MRFNTTVFGCNAVAVFVLVPMMVRAEAPSVIWSASAHSAPVNAVAFSPDGSLLVSASDDHLVKLWRASDGQPLGILTTHYDPATALAFAPDGALLATGSTDREIQVFRMSDRQRLYTTGHGGFVFGLAFSQDAQSLWAGLGYSANELDGFQVSDGQLSAIRRLHWGTVWSVACSRNGQYIATSAADGRVILYSAPYAEYLADLTGHENDVIAARFSPDSSLLASVDLYDPFLILHRVQDGAVHVSIEVGENFIHDIAFSPDGQYIAAAGENWPVNGRIVIYRVSDGALAREYVEGTDLNVGCIAYSPDGGAFAFGRHDGTLALAHSPFACRGDLNGDQVVDLNDLTVLLSHFGAASGASSADGDLDDDSDVDLEDLATLLAVFGTVCT